MDTLSYNRAIKGCLQRLSAAHPGSLPPLAIVLGSGFQALLEAFPIRSEISYDDLPGFPRTGVKGHCNKMVVAAIQDRPVVILCGRAHYYEGYSMEEITFPLRVLAAAGIKDVLLTNAAGGINPKYSPGDFMVVSDHINFMGTNPLRGQMKLFGDCFLDLAGIYDARLGRLLTEASEVANIHLQRGVYAAVCGPIYETPAEIRAFAILGADAVGMSLVPEAIVAHHCQMRVAALSCITNLAAGLQSGSITHQEVLDQSRACAAQAVRLLEEFMIQYQPAGGVEAACDQIETENKVA